MLIRCWRGRLPHVVNTRQRRPSRYLPFRNQMMGPVCSTETRSVTMISAVSSGGPILAPTSSKERVVGRLEHHGGGRYSSSLSATLVPILPSLSMVELARISQRILPICSTEVRICGLELLQVQDTNQTGSMYRELEISLRFDFSFMSVMDSRYRVLPAIEA